jgi:hypothetical protein
MIGACFNLIDDGKPALDEVDTLPLKKLDLVSRDFLQISVHQQLNHFLLAIFLQSHRTRLLTPAAW